jgi:hypothetical protein
MRPTKSELAAQLAACRRELAERRRVGSVLAGVVLGLGGDLRLDDNTRRRCDDAYLGWSHVATRDDAIAREGGEGGG